MWFLPPLLAALIGIIGIGILCTRRLPLGQGRMLVGREAVLSGVVLVLGAAVTGYLTPGYQAALQARADQETKLQAEQERAAKAGELEKERKDVLDRIRSVDKQWQETQRRLMDDAAGGRVDPKKTPNQLLSELRGEKRSTFENRLKEGTKQRNEALEPLRKEDARLKRELKALGPPLVIAPRTISGQTLPLVLPVLSGLVVFVLGWMFARREEPVLSLSPPPESARLAPPPRGPQGVTLFPGTSPGAGQGPTASLPSS